MSDTQHTWDVPHPRNPYFTGRDSYLADLRKHFIDDRPELKHQVLYGFGGIGKSQIALEYAYRYADQYTLVWWLPAEDTSSMGLSLVKLAKAVGLRVGPESSLDEVRHRVRRVLGQMSDWLIVFDNASGPEQVKDFLPLQRSGHVLITSPNGEWGDVASSMPVRTLTREESVRFLHRRIESPDNGAFAAKLAQTLGDLPLALEQAAATMREAGLDYPQYLRRFETHWAELLQLGPSAPDHPDSLAMSLEISFRAVEDHSPASAALMYFCSFLAAEGISKAFLTSVGPSLQAPLNAAMAENLEETLSPLVRFSLVEERAESISVHRLVGALVRRRLSRDEMGRWAQSAAAAARAHFRYNSDEPSTWPAFAAGMPHCLAVANHAERLGVAPDVTADLLSNAGRYLLKQGRLVEALPVLERAIDVTRRVYGNTHPRTSDAGNNLGRVLQRLGRLDEAAEYYALSLAIDRQTYGDDDPRVATVANNYGMCLLAGGDLPAAQLHFEWALRVYEQHYGGDHSKLASVLNNLGCALRDQGRNEEAREAFARGLSMAETNCAPNHPTIASLNFNSGMLMRNVGELDSAENFVRQALRIDESVFGPGHRDVVRDLSALSRILLERGQRQESEQIARRARQILSELSVRTSAVDSPASQ